jgi:hypothetical protein
MVRIVLEVGEAFDDFMIFFVLIGPFWTFANLFGPFQTFSNLFGPQPANEPSPKPRIQLETQTTKFNFYLSIESQNYT